MENSLVDSNDFPYTAQASYLNSAAIGLLPAPVLGKVEALMKDIATRGTRGYFDHGADLTDLPRQAGARLFGTDPANVALVTHASEAMSQIALSLRPGRRENVVLLDTEMAAVTLPWLRVSEETGLEIRVVDTKAGRGVPDIEHIAELVDNSTAAIAISQVNWVSGHRFDLATLAELAHAHGALAIVDCYQAAGIVPIDVVSAGVDLAVTGSFKWLCGLGAAGICYVEPGLAERLRPALTGSMTNAPQPPFDHVDGMALDYGPGARRLEYGSSSPLARYSMGLSIEYLLDVGIQRIFEYVSLLNDRLAAGIERIGGRIVTPHEHSARAGIMSARFDAVPSARIAQQLDDAGVICSSRMGLLRFSPHLFNSGADIDRALDAMATIVS
jgi:selenocysteine lyase/cysteine desulfurase